MNKFTNIFACVSIVLANSAGMGCKKLIAINPPTSKLVTATVFSSNQAATSALLNIYVQMYKNLDTYNIELQTGLLSDELVNSTGNSVYMDFYQNSLQAASDNGVWNEAYNCIYQTNAILEGITNNNVITDAVKNQLIGEGKFLRAFWNFYLVNSYGDVPLVTSTDYSVNFRISRSDRQKVYSQIVKDLIDAEALLNTNYVNASDTVATNPTDRVRPTKWAAAALLARVYLYNKEYDKANDYATSLIDQTNVFRLPGDLDSVFLANSSEAIWQLGVPSQNVYNTPEGAFFYSSGIPPFGISNQLLNSFDTSDNRRLYWMKYYEDGSYYYPYKYKVAEGTDVIEYTMILRLAEQYLIRAEARANGAGTGISGAISDLNVIRTRAGVANYSGAEDKDSVLSAVLIERQHELFTEMGHRWFDLIRTGSANSVMSVVTAQKGGVWSPNWQLYPIPQGEILLDPVLTQNEGYN